MRALVVNVTQLIKNAVAVIKKDSNGYFYFGADDKLPNQIVEKVNNSGTARACVDKLHKFIFANGLVDRALSEKKANGKQTMDAFIQELTLHLPYFKAVCFRVLYDNQGQPSKFYTVPVTQIRRKGDSFIWNELNGEPTYRRAEDVALQEFDPEEPPAARMARIYKQVKKHGKQVGDLVYFFSKGVGLYADKYPVPDYYSGIEDVESDAALQKLENRNITRGFRTPVIISTGPIDNLQQDEQGKTDLDRFNGMVQKFVGEDSASVLHLMGASEEEKPVVTTINIAEILDQTEKTRDRVGRAVCRHFNVSPVLVGFSTAGQLGNNQELKNSMELMKLSVVAYQAMISNALKLVLPLNDWSLTSLKLFDFLPTEVTSKLTVEELKALYEIDLPVVETTKTVTE